MTDRDSEETMQHNHIQETHPNPHGEQEGTEMPLQTDHPDSATESVAQIPSATDNRISPSVAGSVEDPSTDSMFNNADRQTSELLKKNTSKDRSPAKPKGSRRRKTA